MKTKQNRNTNFKVSVNNEYPWTWSVVSVPQNESSNNNNPSALINVKNVKSFLKSPEIIMAFETMMGNGNLFPIQSTSLQLVIKSLENSSAFLNYTPDICISAPTGSGKTMCYILPICDRILSLNYTVSNALQCVILVPSKLLVNQVGDVLIKILGKEFEKRILLLNNSQSFEYEHNRLTFKDKLNFSRMMTTTNIIVSTPHRLLNHLTLDYENKIDLLMIDCVVLDEADKLLTSKNLSRIIKIFERFEKSRKNFEYCTVNSSVLSIPNLHPIFKILVSATIPSNSKLYFPLKLFQPTLIQYKSKSASFTDICENKEEKKYCVPENLKEFFVKSDVSVKPMILLRILLKFLKDNSAKILCFVNSVETASKICFLLNTHHKINAYEISSRLKRKRKNYSVEDFQKENYNVLISTDASSRGIDFKDITCVINYDAPIHLKNYIHRVGRTARAYQDGCAVTFIPSSDSQKYLDVLQKVERSFSPEELIIDQNKLNSLEDWFDEALQLLKLHRKNHS